MRIGIIERKLGGLKRSRGGTEEEARLNEMREMFKQMNEVEQDRADRCKAEEIERRRAEAEAMKDRREEDDKKRDKREWLKERLEGLGIYKETSDLGWYIEKFERIMRYCEVEVEKWVKKLVTRLGERLHVRISSLMDEGAAYEVIREALMKAVGETPVTYGHRIFEMSGEVVKAMTGDEIVDLISRNCRGLFQGAKSVEDCVFALAMALPGRSFPAGAKFSWRIRL